MTGADFLVDPGLVQLNHASFGAPTRALLDRAESCRRELERDTAHGLGADLTVRLAASAECVGRLIGARPGSVALLANSTEAAAAVATSVRRGRPLRVVTLSTEYDSVRRGWEVRTETSGGTVHVLDPDLPVASAEALISLLDNEIDGDVDVLSISHVTSSTALLLPVEALCAWAHERGALAVVDAAHTVGHVAVSVESWGADAVFGTLHKWLPVPRPAGFLWLAPDLASVVRPAAVSLAWDAESLVERFGWRGTVDPAPLLCLPDAIAVWEGWRDAGLLDRAAEIVSAAADRLSALGAVPTGEAALLPPRLRAFLVPGRRLADVRARLDAEGVRVWTGSAPDGRTLLRVATHVWSQPADLDRLAAALGR